MQAQAGLELAAILLQSLKDWDFRCDLSHLTLSTFGSIFLRLTDWLSGRHLVMALFPDTGKWRNLWFFQQWTQARPDQDDFPTTTFCEAKTALCVPVFCAGLLSQTSAWCLDLCYCVSPLFLSPLPSATELLSYWAQCWDVFSHSLFCLPKPKRILKSTYRKTLVSFCHHGPQKVAALLHLILSPEKMAITVCVWSVILQFFFFF